MRLSSLLFLSTPILSLAAPSAGRIAELLAPLATGDSAFLIPLLSPNLTWTNVGGIFGGTYNVSGILNVFAVVGGAINGTFKLETVSIISEGAEGKHSSVELKAPEGTVGKNGVVFDQHLVWITEWEGETIVSNSEYVDTALTSRLFGYENCGLMCVAADERKT